jgi:predicted CXXCH cytochrome family protein
MKKILLAVMAIVFMAGMASAATIVDSKHDMRTHITNETNTEVCVYCHTPHQTGGMTVDPLWNKTLSSVVSYGAYSSNTMNVTPDDWGGSTANVSALCMSCHDGTVAVNSLYNPPNQGDTGTLYFVTGTANLGNDLSNDHPVEFSYTASISGGDTGLKTGGSVTALLIGGRVTCASCHQVHDPTNIPFLRVNNAGSALCTTCHAK